MNSSSLAAPAGTIHDPWPAGSRLLVSLVATLPFLAIYAFHYTSPLGLPTGFIMGDMPSYCANGRAIFERGNGIAYPNPYDPDPQAPAIYFFWLAWFLGFGITKLGIEPGLLFVGIGFVGSIIFCWVTSFLVETMLPSRRFRTTLFLFAMWGGGLLCLAQVARNFLHGHPLLSDLLALDPVDGFWFLNWGRNCIFPTEAVYHALAATALLGVLRRSWRLTFGGATLLAATHPYSGVQILLILETWFTIRLLIERSRTSLVMWLTSSFLLAVSVGYYFGFLESYPQHRAIREAASFDWTLDGPSIVWGYGPIGLAAACSLLLCGQKRDRCMGFWATCFAVSFLLAKHEWFTAPRAPLHFTRGYIWMPLCMIALPAIQNSLVALRARLSPVGLSLAGLFLGAFAVSDNAFFLAVTDYNQWHNDDGLAYFLTPDERDVFTWMDRERLTGVLLCTDSNASYLASVYTALRPYYGHWVHTPRRKERLEHITTWVEKGEGGTWLTQIDYFLFPRDRLPPFLDRADYVTIYENDGWILLGRKDSGSKSTRG